MKPICIYHGNCADGFGGAWVFHKYANQEFDFHPGVYGQEPPEFAGREVYLVDFSYKREVVEDICTLADRVVLIDHHASAIRDLAPLIDAGKVEALTSTEHSGAVLAWKWFHGNDLDMPPLLRHIEDRDLWRFALPGTREIQANLFSHPYDFAVWDGLMGADVMLLQLDGAAIERKHHKDIAELLKVMQRTMLIADIEVPVACLPYTLASDAGAAMAKNMPFAATYYDTCDHRIFSLRSNEHGVDVSKVAEMYGGGGHRNAAGFRVARTHPLAQA